MPFIKVLYFIDYLLKYHLSKIRMFELTAFKLFKSNPVWIRTKRIVALDQEFPIFLTVHNIAELFLPFHAPIIIPDLLMNLAIDCFHASKFNHMLNSVY